MLTEDQVVDRTCEELQRRGYRIVSRAHAHEQGDDIVAVRGPQRLIIEAKGAGSSKAGTNRYGSEFTSGQVYDHVAKAVLKAMRVLSTGAAAGGIALPDNPAHRAEVAKAQPALRDAGILVVWVSPTAVSFDPTEGP